MNSYPEVMYPHSRITEEIIGLGIKVHSTLGPGFREKYYQRAMYLELQKSGLTFVREKRVEIMYGKAHLGYQLLDFVVEDLVVVELKSMSGLTSVEVGQLSKYLKLSKCTIGLLLNFGTAILEIKRVIV